jgi:hypothetical protein
MIFDLDIVSTKGGCKMGKASKRKNFLAVLVLLCSLFLLLSCGGGSSGGGDAPNPNNSSPVVQIVSPADGSNFAVGDEIQFSGSCSDNEDGVLSGSSLVWTSDLDGQIGTGETFNSTTLSTGSHQITLTGTDSNGAVGTDTVTIIVSQTVTGLFDLTVGKTFNYKVTDLNNSSNSWLATVYIQDTEIIGSTAYYNLIVTNEYGTNEVRAFTARSTKDEFYFFIGGSEILWFKTGNVGYSFIRWPGGDNDTATVTAIGDITVPYGVVSAYEFSITEQGAVSPYLIQSVSPGIGLVRLVDHDNETIMELVSY